MNIEGLKPIGTINGKVVIQLEVDCSMDTLERIKSDLVSQFGPDVVVLMHGMHIANLSEERLDRIEAKLDQLMERTTITQNVVTNGLLTPRQMERIANLARQTSPKGTS